MTNRHPNPGPRSGPVVPPLSRTMRKTLERLRDEPPMLKPFHKKPVVIGAYQMLTANDAGEGVCTGGHTCPKHGPPSSHPHIHTLEGDHTWTAGDWVIRGVAGEFYFCKPDIFARTYDPEVQGGGSVA